MNKKFIKKVLSFILVCILSVNSYAAVGANDGSAFITKPEFDALVNTFNEQMDNYENSLVSKVDGAIANYLAGISDVTVFSQENIVEKANKYAADSVIMWYKELVGKDTNESDIMVQQGETVVANTQQGNIWRLRIFGQEAGDNYWKSGDTKGNYYLITKERVLMKYYKDTYIKHYFAGSASNSYNSGGSTVDFPQIHYLQNRTDISTSQYDIKATNGSNTYTCRVMQYMSLEKTIEETYKNNCVWLTLPDKNYWTIYDDEVDKVTSQGTVTGSKYKGGVAGPSINCNDPKSTKYKPKAQEINLNTLISKPISEAYGQTVLAYEGCPILKCSEDGKVKFTMKWTTYGGSTSSTQYVQFGLNKTHPFSNTNTLAIDPNLSTNITQNMAQNGKEINVEISGCKKGDIIWIKGTPVSADSASVEISELIIETED